ncbi:FkbM family methyltransferase [Flavihumibacter sp. R14]|nr:FkbM family methyltransferase [Flavihumibacter soli]
MKKILKRIIPEGSLLYDLCSKLVNKERRGLPPKWKFDLLLAYSNYNGQINFVQIGSNNGTNGDPLYKYIISQGWKGVLVEPVPYLFEELKKNYLGLNDDLAFENSAVSLISGDLKFYRLKQSNLPNLPGWYDQLGSFNKEVVEKHRSAIPDFDDLLIEDTVNGITFKQLLSKYSIVKLDVLHIDTEGYDYEILKMLPFETLTIDLIMFEHKHLTAQDYQMGLNLLRQNGFTVGLKDASDTIAIRTDILEASKKFKRP